MHEWTMAGSLFSKKEKIEEGFPDTLSDFGYAFDKDGKLKNKETGKPFQFVVREGDHSYNQRHYEALGEVVTEEVYKLLETECKLKRAPVPHDASKDEPSTFVFISEDALVNTEKLLVLIHGSGVVRAGQWARRLIMNDSLDSGTQIPFIKRAQKEGYGILVTNTNDNYRIDKKKCRVKIRGSENPERHTMYVWEHYTNVAKAKNIAIIAHSYGGCVTNALYLNKKEEFLKRVFAVAMTDSVHFIHSPNAFKELVKISCNWVCSRHPLDTPIDTQSGDIKRVSAGVTVHEETSWASMSSIFKFLEARLKATTKPDEGAGDTRAEPSAQCSPGKGHNPVGPAGGHDREDEDDATTPGNGKRKDDNLGGGYGSHDMSEEEEDDDDDGKEGDKKKQKMNASK